MKKIRVDDLGKIVTGKTPRTNIPENYGGNVPFLTPTDDLSPMKCRTTLNTISELGLKEVKNCIIPKDSICVSCIGSDMGHAIMTSKATVTNQQFNSIIPSKDYHPEYVYYLMVLLGRMMKSKFGKSSTAVPIVSKSLFSSFEIYIEDDKRKQKEISDVLANIDEKIALNTRMNAELEAMAKQLYDYWFVQFDFPDENGNPYKSSGGKMVYNSTLKREIPAGWEVKTLNDLVETPKESITPFENPDKEYKHYSIPAFDTCGSYLLEKGRDIQSNKFVVHKGQILAPKLNPWYNRIIMVNNSDDAICSTEYVVLDAIEEYTKGFLFFVLKTDSFISYCTKGSSGTSHSQRRVPPEILKGFSIPFNKTIVSMYTDFVKYQIDKLNGNQEQTRKLTHLRDSLLPMLMNGQVTVE